jgi:hypothetical protein
MAYSDWDTTAADNTTIGAVPLGENAMAPSDVNNAFRELIAQLATYRDHLETLIGSSTDYQPLDATLTAVAAITTAANKLIYATGSDTFSTTDLTAYGRTLIGLADAAALRTNLGALTVTASSLAATGYIKLDIAGTTLMVQWGSGTIGANTTGTISFSQSYTSFARCVVSGGTSNAAIEGAVRSVGTAGLSSQSISNGGNASATYSYIVVGV